MQASLRTLTELRRQRRECRKWSWKVCNSITCSSYHLQYLQVDRSITSAAIRVEPRTHSAAFFIGYGSVTHWWFARESSIGCSLCQADLTLTTS